MRYARSLVLLIPALTLTVASASSCGARTTLDETESPSGQGGGNSGEGGAGVGGDPSIVSGTTSVTTSTAIATTATTGTGGGLPMNPVISKSPNSFVQSETSVVAGSNGRVAVAWIDVSQLGSSVIGYAVSTDGGATFGAPQFLKTPLPGAAQASDPVLAVDPANNFYLTWVGYLISPEMTPVNMHVYVAKAPSNSTTFGAPTEVSKPVSLQEGHDKPWITVTNMGTVLVTYSTATEVTKRLHASRSNDGGLTWQHSIITEDTELFRNLAFVCAPSKDGRIWVTYIAVDGAIKSSVGLSWSDDQGATWTPTATNTVVSQPNDPVAFDDPTCVADGNDVWISYALSKDPAGTEDSPANFAIKVAHSGDGGKTIDFRIDAQDPATGPLYQHPQITRESTGAIDLVYYAGSFDGDSNGSYVRSRWTGTSGTGFAPSTVIEAPIDFVQSRKSPEWLGDYTGLFALNGVLYTSYATNTSGASHIAYASFKVP